MRCYLYMAEAGAVGELRILLFIVTQSTFYQSYRSRHPLLSCRLCNIGDSYTVSLEDILNDVGCHQFTSILMITGQLYYDGTSSVF